MKVLLLGLLMQLSYFKGWSPSYKVFLFGGLVFFVSLSWSMYLLSISTMIMFLSILLSDSIGNKLIASKNPVPKFVVRDFTGPQSSTHLFIFLQWPCLGFGLQN
ncbi:MAG: hypothetical protein IPN97_07750 [Saprospiraceae bacterium]|nr:hypothetical protein [Saprospiraceae bacterium]